MITQLGNGDEGMRQAREFMRLPGAKGKTGVDKLARVCGLDALFVGKGNE